MLQCFELPTLTIKDKLLYDCIPHPPRKAWVPALAHFPWCTPHSERQHWTRRTSQSSAYYGLKFQEPPASCGLQSRALAACRERLSSISVQPLPVDCLTRTVPTESSQSKVLGRLLLCQRRQVVLECLYRWLDWLNLLPHLRQA